MPRLTITPKGEVYREEDDKSLYQITQDGEIRIADSRHYADKEITPKTKKFWDDLETKLNSLIAEAPKPDASAQERKSVRAQKRLVMQLNKVWNALETR